MLPNFLCIGTQRSGSTWLYSNLKKHPEIWLPPVKEIQYFNEKEKNYSPNLLNRFLDSKSVHWRLSLKYQVKVNFNHALKNLSNVNRIKYQNIFWNLKYFFYPRNDRWYASLFDPGDNKITGDISPVYLRLKEESVAHIHKIMPQAKIILILRNPIQRAWSHAILNCNYQNKSVETISETEWINICRPRGSNLPFGVNLVKTLRIWQSFYPKEQFFIGFFEDIQNCPEEFLLSLYEFLEVEVSKKYIAHHIANKKINSRTKDEIPHNLAVYLAGIYFDEIKELNRQLGGYTSNWLEYCNDLIA